MRDAYSHWYVLHSVSGNECRRCPWVNVQLPLAINCCDLLVFPSAAAAAVFCVQAQTESVPASALFDRRGRSSVAAFERRVLSVGHGVCSPRALLFG